MIVSTTLWIAGSNRSKSEPSTTSSKDSLAIYVQSYQPNLLYRAHVEKTLGSNEEAGRATTDIFDCYVNLHACDPADLGRHWRGRFQFAATLQVRD